MPSNTLTLWQNIPAGANVSIANIAGRSNFINLTLNTGSSITVRGVLKDNSSGLAIFNRQVDLYYNNTLVGSDLTDSNGNWAIQFTIPRMAGNTTLYAVFNANNVYLSQSIAIEAIIPPSFAELLMPYLPWIIGIVVGLVERRSYTPIIVLYS
jgi:hypothetical protein